jgi:hypothetical protein
VICIQSDGIEWLDQNKMKEMEDLFVSCSQIEADLLREVFAGSEKRGTKPSMSRQIRELCAEFERLLSVQ